MKRTLAVILAGGEGQRLSILSSMRAKPAVPFGGKYRMIDFSLSNCVNSDITDVLILTQYNPRSLNDHIGLGRPWDLDRNKGGIKLLQPYIARGRVAEWYRGTADAVLRNINVIERSDADTIVVLAGDHIYKMDYQPFIQAHRRKRADVTIAVRRVPLAEATRMGILALDETDRVIEWQEKPKHPKSDLASMGVYVFSKRSLRKWLSEDLIDFGRDVIPAMQHHWWRGLVGGAMQLLSYGIAIWAMTVAPIALVAALRETSVLFGAIIAVLVLKEPLRPVRLAAALLILCGLVLIRLQ